MAGENTSVIDVPHSRIAAGQNVSKGNDDPLGTSVYAAALTSFIEKCRTPMTIGVQGEWGSGKTSILNMIKEDLDTKPGQFEVIWINTWEHSILKSPEETLISVINEIIDSISSIDGKWSSATKAKQALQGVVKGVAKIGVSYVAGAAAAEAVENGFEGSNGIKHLRKVLRDILSETIKGTKRSKFVIFIDDLDRLDPPVAVQVLELLKNIFDLEYCVFVLAIDYQVVVKGLKSKFGEPTDENEWEFRAFFDKIIQLPFMMPMSSYTHNNYLVNLLEEVDFLHGKTINSISSKGEDSWLTNVVRFCIGYNPRSMKRLANSLSMVKLLAENRSFNLVTAEQFRDTKVKNLTLCLVCLQIAFPKVYELLQREPAFISRWNKDFVKSVTRPSFTEKKYAEARNALDAAFVDEEDDWDEEWEKSLFLIVWINGWQKNRVTETSRVLSIIKDHKQLLGALTTSVDNQETESEEFLNTLNLALSLSAVTSVASSDVKFNTRGVEQSDDDSAVQKEVRQSFWRAFSEEARGKGSAFDPDVQKWKGQGAVSSGHMARYIDRLPGLEMIARINQTTPLELKVVGDGEQVRQTEEFIFSLSEEIRRIFQGAEVIIDRESKKISIPFNEEIRSKFKKNSVSFFLTTEQSVKSVDETERRKIIDASLALRNEAIQWLVPKLSDLDQLLRGQLNNAGSLSDETTAQIEG